MTVRKGINRERNYLKVIGSEVEKTHRRGKGRQKET